VYQSNDAGPILKDFSRLTTLEKMKKVFNKSTELCVDLKTILRSDCITEISKSYQGVLTRDNEEQFTFLESVPQTAGKRNLHVFDGKFITVTRRDDGSLRPNFKPMKVDKNFSVYRYALGVYNEICLALEGLVEEA
jgi:hypothetical protein